MKTGCEGGIRVPLIVWKLIRWYAGPVELYNLKADLAEQRNLVNEMPDKAAELDAALSAELKRVGAKLPRPNPEFAGK